MPISINGTTASVTGLTNGTQYRFRVAARNAVGLGPYTAPTTAGAPSGATPPPPAAKPGETWTVITEPDVVRVEFVNNKFYTAPRTVTTYPPQSWAGAPRSSTNGATWTTGVGFSTGSVTPTTPDGVPFNGQSFAYGAPGGGALWLSSCPPGRPDSHADTHNVKWGISTDGTTWTPLTRPAGSQNVVDVLFDGQRFVARALNSVIFWSANGYSGWQSAAPSNVDVGCTVGAIFLGVDNPNNNVGFYRARNTTNTWDFASVPGSGQSAVPAVGNLVSTNLPLSATSFAWGGPIVSPSGYIAVDGQNRNKYYTALTGAEASWTTRTLPSLYRFAGSAPLAYGNSWWLALGELATEPVGSASRVVLRSGDGVTWEAVNTLPSLARWNRIVFGGGRFVATGQAGPSGFSTPVAAWCQ